MGQAIGPLPEGPAGRPTTHVCRDFTCRSQPPIPTNWRRSFSAEHPDMAQDFSRALSAAPAESLLADATQFAYHQRLRRTGGLRYDHAIAGVAKQADARDLKSRDSQRVVWVRSPPPAPAFAQARLAPASVELRLAEAADTWRVSASATSWVSWLPDLNLVARSPARRSAPTPRHICGS